MSDLLRHYKEKQLRSPVMWCQGRAVGTASRLWANIQNGSGAHLLQVPFGYPDVWFLTNPSAQMLGHYLNIILASAKCFRSGHFHEFLFTSPQLSHPYKMAENYWLLRFISWVFIFRMQFTTHTHHLTLYNLHILLFRSLNNTNAM